MSTEEAGQASTGADAPRAHRSFLPPNTAEEVRIGLLLIVFAHTCDLVSTYLRTQDLSREVGPVYLALARAGLSGWPVLLTLKGFGVLLTAALFLFYVRTRRAFYPPEPGKTFHEFLHDVHGKNAIRRANGRWAAPSLLLIGIWMAFTTSIGSAAYAYFLAVHNMLATPLLVWMANGVVPGAIFIVTAIAFWRTLYHDYMHMHGDRASGAG